MRLGPFTFGYNATEDKDRRQRPQTRVYHESEVLTKKKRKQLVGTAQDQMRNHSLVAWMVRKHLDYVSKFHMSFRTGRDPVDVIVNRIFKWHGAPRNLDFLGRFGRDEMFRLFELEKVLAGDAGLLKLDGLKLQALESDLIAKGTDAPEEINDSGVVVDASGRITDYAICKRGGHGKVLFDHKEAASNVIFDGYWTRFSSQYRGVSPLSSAINMVQDLHEAFEYNLVKAKMHALFGLAITRDVQGSGDFGGAAGAISETEDADSQDDGSHLDINPRSINILDLNPGDDAKVIESGTPSSEFIEGSYLFIQIAMLALDIPVTCFDSRRSSFSGRIADLNEYEVSADHKRTKNRYVRSEYSDWLLSQIWNTPKDAWRLREIATANGMMLRDIQESVEWVASGSPWLDKYKQIQGDKLGIEIGLDNAIDAARRRGGDVFANIDKQAKVLEYAKAKGVPIVLGNSGQRTVEETEAETEENDNGTN